RIVLEVQTAGREWRATATRNDVARGRIRLPKAAVHAWNGLASSPGLRSLKRITIETDKYLAALPWERALPQPGNIVRVPRVMSQGFEPFKLPMRIAQVGGSSMSVPKLVRSLFRKAGDQLIRHAVRVIRYVGLDAFDEQAETEPTTDVLHLERS